MLAGLNLRIAVASVPPVLDELRRDLGLSPVAAGLLTSAPVVCFGLLAPAASPLARRLGGEKALLAPLLAVAAGILLRSAPHTAALFAGTVLAGAGVAIANVITPTVVRSRFQHRTGAVMGLYAAALSIGAALAGGLTVPIEHALGRGWEPALAVWALPAALAAAILAAALAHDEGEATARGVEAGARALLKDTLAWQVTLFMALQSLVFYAALAWLPTILVDHGYGAVEAGGLLALLAVGGIPTALLAPILAARIQDQRALATAVAALEGAAVAGLLAAPDAAYAWVALFAAGQGGAIALALTLIVLRAPDAQRAADLSGMAQAIGYSLAAAGPFLLGVLYDGTGGWSIPLGVLLGVVALLLGAGLGAGRPLTVRASE